MTRLPLLSDWMEHVTDATQRSILFWDTLRQRGNAYLAHVAAGQPPLLKFPYETLLDARGFERPCNYALLRILPRESDAPTDARKRPFVVVDPRAGHGPGIGGFKEDSEIGNALQRGHPVYFVTFFPEPMPGQRLLDVMLAEARFLEEVRARHPDAPGGPCVIGNCQAGWAIMGLAALRPELPGPLLIAGAPLSYWAGAPGLNPMRYSGGLLGGSWLSHLASDLGNGRFDGANLVLNFEGLNPGNTWWSKYANLYDRADSEGPRFLEFERWWGGYFLMNREEITAIVEELFIGNKLARGEITSADGTLRLDLRNIRSPICVLCSWGDDITPPHQALGWVLDLYASDEDVIAQGQTIVYCVHPNVGHLGIFVSGAVARKEHAEFVELLDLIETLPPGLYEMVIEDKQPGLRAGDLVPGRYVTRFEARGVADVAALCGDRSEERPFEVVRRVSEVNAGLYRQLAQPVVQGFATEAAAEAARQFHPLRAQRWALSDMNPMLWPLQWMAPWVREHRAPAAEDNPFREMERAAVDAVRRGWEAVAATRDTASALGFNALYATPFARAVTGLAEAPPPRALGADPLRVEHARREVAALLARPDEGSRLEGVLRILLLMMDATGQVDERGVRALRAAAAELPAGERPTLAEIRRVARHQALLIRADRAAAVEGLKRIFAAPEDRTWAEALLRQVARRLELEPGSLAALLTPERPALEAPVLAATPAAPKSKRAAPRKAAAPRRPKAR